MQNKRICSLGVIITIWLFSFYLVCAHDVKVRFGTVFGMFVHISLITAFLNVQSPTALTIKDSTDDIKRDEETQFQDDDDDNEDLEVFRPTDQWQTLRPGGYIPMGHLTGCFR